MYQSKTKRGAKIIKLNQEEISPIIMPKNPRPITKGISGTTKRLETGESNEK